MLKCWLVIGKYPEFLINLWNDFDAQGEGSENDSPEMFTEDQLFIVLELENGGRSLEAFTFNSAEQSFSIFVQVRISLSLSKFLINNNNRFQSGFMGMKKKKCFPVAFKGSGSNSCRFIHD